MNLIPLNFITQGEQTPLRRMMLERALAGGGALSEYEITGNPVAFNTNLARPLSAFTIPFLPVQSGTGDPSPSNVRHIIGWQGLTAWRTGANLLNIDRTEGTPNPASILVSPRAMDTDHYYIGCHADNYYYKPYVSGSVQNGVITVSSLENNSYGIGFPVAVKGNQKYTINFTAQSNVLIGVSYYDAEWNFISNGGDIYPSHLPNAVKTTPANASYMVLIFRSSVGQTYTYSDIMVTAGETDAEYSPYTGASYPVTFPATGKNLFDKSTPIQYGQYYSKGSWLSGDNRICTDYVPVEEGETYTFSVPTDNAANLRFINYNLFNEDKVWLGDRAVNGETTSFNGAASHTFTVNLPGAKYVRMVLRDKSGSDANITDRTLQNADLQLEKGSTATAYEPYTNTICGGTLDAVNGVLTVEWAKHIVSLTDNTALSQAMNEDVYRIGLPLPDFLAPVDGADRLNLYCNIGKNSLTIFGGSAQVGDCSFFNWNGACVFLIGVPSSENTTAKGKQWLVNNGCEVVRKLATPYEIPLSDIPVPVTLIGDNTIWTDTNGENTVKYLKKG